MFKHHQDTINNVTKKMKENSSVLALIIGGSIAHGFAKEDSDVDIMIVVSEEEYKTKYRENKLTYWEKDSCTYENGYVDGKYISMDFMRKVSKHGSEAARFAFKDAFVAYSKIDGVEQMLQEISRYPKELKDDKMKRFFAQLYAWNWFYSEGRSKNNSYLIEQAITNMILFGGRAILAYNELLFPYHKWFLRVLESAKEKPADLMKLIDNLLETKTPEAVDNYVQAITGFTDWGIEGTDWPRQFMMDSELGWMTGNCSIYDI